MRVWRLTKAAYAPGLDGEGARLWGGRWNSPGVPMVYTASSLSLAVLEVLVHLPPQMRRAGGFPPFVAVCLGLPDDPPTGPLPADLSEQSVTRGIGDAFVTLGRDLTFKVPSLVIPQDWNVLINPKHPDIARVQVEAIVPFQFDDRLGSP